jgi:hypothetical protein
MYNAVEVSMLRAAQVILSALFLAAAVSSASADDAPATAPSTSPSSDQPHTPRDKLSANDPIDALLTEIAVRYDAVILKARPADAVMLRDADMPATLDESLKLAQSVLEPQGLGLIRSTSASGGLVLKLTTSKEAKEAAQADGPVTSGWDPSKIDVTKPNLQITHLMIVHHNDMVDSLRRTAMQQKGVDVNIAGTARTGYTLIFTGPALGVQRALTEVAKLDDIPTVKTATKVVTLRNISAVEGAFNLNAGFSRDGLGLHAEADRRTNSVIITGPDDLVPQAVTNLIGMDGYTGVRPNTPPDPGH